MIRFVSVSKHFGEKTPALDNVTLEVQKGEFVFLTGPSGSGKSTMLKLITKEYTPTQGEIEFEQTPLSSIRGTQLHHHRRRIGVVFQDYRLLPEMNVWENIALPLQIMGKSDEEIAERVTDLLELVQLADRPYAFPNQLSGGESQRVGIARALATAPSVLLADEPTGNLDPQTTLMIARLFHKIHELGTTILFATHDPSILATFPNRRVHLEKGRMVEDTGGGKVHHTKKTEHAAEPKHEAPQPAEKQEKKTKEHTEPPKDTSPHPPAPKSSASSKKAGGWWPFGKKKGASPSPSPEPNPTASPEAIKKKPADQPTTDDLAKVMVQIEDLT